jgi:hypothetical protein
VEQHGIAIRQVQLLLLTSEPAGALLHARNEAFADSGGEQLVLFFGDPDLVKVGVLELVLGVLVLVLQDSGLAGIM